MTPLAPTRARLDAVDPGAPTPDDLDFLETLAAWPDARLRRLGPARLARAKTAIDVWRYQHARENPILYYRPLNADARRVHLSTAREFGIQGGNKSGKTGTLLAELTIQMTGVVPYTLRGVYPMKKIRPPIRARLVVSSLATAWDTNLKLKLQWWEWNGDVTPAGLPGDIDQGHFGWIPRRFLISGDWEKSWSEKHMLLTLNRDGDAGTTPGSTLQVVSHNTALTDINQGSYHVIIEDEIPPEDLHRANRLRTLEVHGRVYTGGTPSDDYDTAVAVAWYFDQILIPGLEQSDPEAVDAVALWTEHNPTLSEAALAGVTRGLTADQRRVRLHGESLHLAGLIYPGVTEKPKIWCCRCAGPVRPAAGVCPACQGSALVPYCHVWDDRDVPPDVVARWPVVFYMDPHQARPTACAWIAVDPADQWWQVGEAEIPGDAAAVKAAVERIEAASHWAPVWRKGDPKITIQTNQFAREFEGQPFTIRRAFEEVGFDFEEANTNFSVGRERLLQALAVSPVTRAPRLRIHRSCTRTLYSMLRFTWRQVQTRDGAPPPKEEPSRRHSDFPALLRYLSLDDPEHRQLERTQAPRVLHAGAHLGRAGVTGW